MGFYEGLRDGTAKPLITQYGIAATMERSSASNWSKEYDAVEMSNYWVNSVTHEHSDVLPSDLPTTYTGTVVVTDMKEDQIDGSLVKAGDQMLITADLPEPSVGDIFTVNGIRYAYVDHETVAPAGVVVIYKIQVRK